MRGSESPRSRRSVVEPCVAVIAVISVFYILSGAAMVAVPFVLALLLAVLFAPLVNAGVRRGVPPMAMVLAVLALLLAVLIPLGALLGVSASNLIEYLPNMHNGLLQLAEDVIASMPEFLRSRLDVDLGKELRGALDFKVLMNYLPGLADMMKGMTGLMVAWLGRMTMMLVFLVFMLLEAPSSGARLRRVFRGRRGESAADIASKIIAQISKYLRTLAVISLVTGLFVWGALSLIGVNFAPAWGALAFLLNFIPTIGSILASIPPILAAIVQFFPGWGLPALTALSLLVIQFVIGNIITPKVMGDTLDLSPVVILISLMCWGMIWGFAGALVSVPLAVMIKIICENVPRLRFVAELMRSARAGAPEAGDAKE